MQKNDLNPKLFDYLKRTNQLDLFQSSKEDNSSDFSQQDIINAAEAMLQQFDYDVDRAVQYVEESKDKFVKLRKDRKLLDDLWSDPSPSM